MVSQTAGMAVKKSSKDSGPKKVFSVPVGKLRIKFATPGRSGSNSGSGSISVHRHKLLLRNNKELARSLSVQKERCRMIITENLNLKTLLHECKLEVVGLEKQLSDSRKSNSITQERLAQERGHLWDAIRHSVSLTESLKHALGVDGGVTASEDPNPRESLVSRETSGSRGSTPLQSICSQMPVAQPQKQRVNPMISGHTIRYPTISLKRVILDGDNKAAEKKETPIEERPPTQTPNEVVSESVEDVSQTVESSQESRVGLTTCFEEDEDEDDMNEDDDTAEEMESDEEDSIRRKIISFRRSIKEKDKSRSVFEAEETGGSSDSSGSLPKELNGTERGASHEIGTPKISLPVKISSKMSDDLVKRTPVVELNDVGKLLQNSRSINVLKMSLVDHKSNSVEIGAGLPHHASENEDNSCPKQSVAFKTTLRECGEYESSQQCLENSVEKRGAGDNKSEGKGNSMEDSPMLDVKDKTQSSTMDDPLEGTSWMHLNYFSGKKNKRKSKGHQRPTKFNRISPVEATVVKNEADKIIVHKTLNQINRCVRNGETVHPVVEAANFLCVPGSQKTKVSESNTGKIRNCDDDFDCDVGDISSALRNNLIAQSTPMHKGKQTQNYCELPSTAVSLESSRKSSSDTSQSNLVSSLNDGSSHSVDEMGEKSFCISPFDSKLNGKAFVTVRVKRLALSDLSPVNNLAGTFDGVGCNCNNLISDHSQETDEELDFLGFDGVCVADECSNFQAITKNISTVVDVCLVSGDVMQSLDSTSAHSFGTSYDSGSMEIENCDASANNDNKGGRPRRRAAPKELKEPNLNRKLRRETKGPKRKKRK